ncbi:1-deoxy-D-xylulose-5-phosphate synthase [Candidatus Cyrtobacter comes]|uniref:1-deoxy-D-xylulose-5-phosphate synthase n=1 Tax=Candidatus Cyrtobacter comes TaxID=675776 RepID=A0ABU5L8W0_9RICK|nr:1-deoxy-D-xylulose-5-phosphate synthase [Candidatus Cyrtobacter comes]MDZ5762325.1 1-deoxy-D-xylulose-5-phosphate synthase [Candidatus Cyrtobacter comes]
MRILDNINSPKELRDLNPEDLIELSKEIRDEIISIALDRGGHLGASLGVVELTIAIHYIFNTPEDLLVWDIGHQSYPHKILTQRRNALKDVRKKGHISGFLRRSESIYDTFGAGHSSTSISAALGMAIANKLNNKKANVISVIGDGALSSGMAYEAINNVSLHEFNGKFLIILNDNKMSISPAVGALTRYLTKLITSVPLLKMRNLAKDFIKFMPNSLSDFAKKAEKHAKSIISGNNLFEGLGMHYIGPVDGHDIYALLSVLENIKNNTYITNPVLLHIITEKGRGFIGHVECDEMYHTISSLHKKKSDAELTSMSQFCVDTLIDIAKNDDRVVAISAAMLTGTCLKSMKEIFPDRVFDTGIAEQHAVTFAAGLASQGIKPFVDIYSTFLQRAYDQIIHDVAIQSLPVRFLIDRAGFTGEDGPTHAGIFDIAFLSNIPNFVVMAPSSPEELAMMIFTAYSLNDRPCAIRFPKCSVTKQKLEKPKPIPLGIGRVIMHGVKLAVISLGTRLECCIEAAKILESEYGVSITIADARFAKPIDYKLIEDLARSHEVLFTVEEGVIGGFGSHVAEFLGKSGVKIDLEQIFIPDKFIEHQTIEEAYKEVRMCTNGLVDRFTKKIKEFYSI